VNGNLKDENELDIFSGLERLVFGERNIARLTRKPTGYLYGSNKTFKSGLL
jgi:hypothetical protein